MTEQPIESPTEQDWLGNPVKSAVENYLHAGHRLRPLVVSSIAELDIQEASHEAASQSSEALALMRTRLNTQTLLNIAEKESARAEEALTLALAVEDRARGEVLKAADAIDEFARKTASA
ncbi:hypothetical protein [Pseudarthrobacter cellobiosi]|uniref:hypothetical protein n=1 Tax=Pseudarthrobacter cellobiosi TaxID=2953654 RepID=UPI00208DE633|nr:hypothetical protein [Pseudarthrobacter sp. HLT1-5]MCO4256488.1 hypothetical protein [Pseudarthrobacter sp. HLT1-5]